MLQASTLFLSLSLSHTHTHTLSSNYLATGKQGERTLTNKSYQARAEADRPDFRGKKVIAH